MYQIENIVTIMTPEDKKKLSAGNNKILNILKQKIKKYNKNFEKEIEEFKKVSFFISRTQLYL